MRLPTLAALAIMLPNALVLAAEATPEIVRLPLIEQAGQQWFRHVFVARSTDGRPTELSVSSEATVSVYLNGQRLVRDRKPAGRRLIWQISKLLRPGRNCLALATASDAQPALMSVKFASTEKIKLQVGQWKVVTSTPPVGWQQTDFNDRDWAVAKTRIAADSADAQPAIALNWEQGTQGSHIENGWLRLHDGDHVVMIGGTFIERAQSFGHLESTINAKSASRKITFRNLGWSGDTVFAESRGIFDSPEKGYERMIEHVRAEEPNVILVCYGQNEAMSFPMGAAGIERFRTQLDNLYRDLSAAGADVIFLSPHPLLSINAPLPNPTRWNKRIDEFVAVIRDFTVTHNAGFVDLFSGFVRDVEAVHGFHTQFSPMPTELLGHSELEATRNAIWTQNGMHWNDAGYQRVAEIVASRLLDRPLQQTVVYIDPVQKSVRVDKGKLRGIEWEAGGGGSVQFEYLPECVSAIPLVVSLSEQGDAATPTVVEEYASGGESKFVSLRVSESTSELRFVGGSSAAYSALKELTVRKNELYFHRWRPQNITYLFGFRKHEQGNNASEIAQFDPLIDTLEERIHAAKQPKWRKLLVSALR